MADEIKVLIYILAAIILVVVVASSFMDFLSPSTAEAVQILEERGYVVMSSAEYNALYSLVQDIWAHDHSEQFVSPIDAPTSLTSGAGAYVLGNFSGDIIAAGATTHDFDITAIGFGTPDENGTYTVILYAGALDTEIGQVSFNRQGVFTASIYRDMQTEILPAGTRVRAKMKSQVAGATCVTKVYYHYN